MGGREGKSEEFPKTSHLSEKIRSTWLSSIHAELASSIQVQKHIQVLLLLLVFSLQHKLSRRFGGERDSTRATVHRDHTEPFCKFTHRVPRGKRRIMSGAVGCISAPLHPLPQAPSRTAKHAWSYAADRALGWHIKPCLKNVKHKRWTCILVVCSASSRAFLANGISTSLWCETILPLCHQVLVGPSVTAPCPPDHISKDRWLEWDPIPSLEVTYFLTYYLLGAC